ncbi:MAG: hypothetical protein KF858_09680 [Candidatus Sumerlaeia bacterium]|nr:hypothetical protein [Candidatus Sumerlaeia bacterium]
MTESFRASSPVAPATRGSWRLLGRGAGFWKTAVAAGCVAGALAFFESQPLDIRRPGVLPLGLVLVALLVAGPPRRFESNSMRRVGVLGLVVLFLAWMGAGALGLAAEHEAALLTLPAWALMAGLLVVGWRFRQQDLDLLVVTLLGAGVLRGIANLDSPTFRATELPWWIAVTLWCVIVPLARRQLERQDEDSTVLIGGVSWIVLMLGTLTAQERQAIPEPLLLADRTGALEAFRAAALTGWGSGGFERVMQEYAQRAPALGPFATQGVVRLLVEIGGVACLVLALASMLAVAETWSRRAWEPSRLVLLGAAGLWVVAALAMRQTPFIPLAILFLLWPGIVGREEVPDESANPDDLPPFAWTGWVGAVACVAIMALAFPLAEWAYERQAPRDNLGVTSPLPGWTVPHRDQAWLIRDRSAELARFTDPRTKLKPVLENWIAASPHDEDARIEWVRWASRTLPPAQAEREALEAHERLPWSPGLALWVVRLKLERGGRADAIAFLERLARERAPLPIPVQARLNELKREEAAEAARARGRR